MRLNKSIDNLISNFRASNTHKNHHKQTLIMKVLIADQFSPAGMEEMKTCGMDVHYDSSLNGAALVAKLAEVQPEVLVVRSTKVQQDAIDATTNLQLVVRAGAGYDTIDFNYCS